MKITKISIFGKFILALFFFGIIIASIKYYYFDIYLMTLSGPVEAIRTDIKEAMYITVAEKEHNLAHFWPNLQKNIKVGDSVYKNSREYNITLVKKNTKEKIVCTYREDGN